MPDGSGRGQEYSEAEHDPCREAKIILRDSENMSEQPVSLHSPSHSFDQLVIKPAPDVSGKSRIGGGEAAAATAYVSHAEYPVNEWRNSAHGNRNTRAENHRV